MPVYYDDNFGFWDMRDEEDREFYEYCQRTNVEKYCERCHRKVRIQPQYAYCNSCAEKIEQGWDF